MIFKIPAIKTQTTRWARIAADQSHGSLILHVYASSDETSWALRKACDLVELVARARD